MRERWLGLGNRGEGRRGWDGIKEVEQEGQTKGEGKVREKESESEGEKRKRRIGQR